MPAGYSAMYRWQSCRRSPSILRTSSMLSFARCRFTLGFHRASVKLLSVNTRPFMNDSGGRFALARSRPWSLLELFPDLARHRFCLAERGSKRGLLRQVGHSPEFSLVLLRYQPEVEVGRALRRGVGE